VIAPGWNCPFAPILTVPTEKDESSSKTRDNGRVQGSVFGGAKEARGAAASPLPSPAVLCPSVVLRFCFYPDFAMEGT
jgi:hypothetical protein